MNLLLSETPAISAIIPTHGRASLLRQSLESLCDQTLAPSEFEVVVVDDESTDQTDLVCKEFSERLNLRYFRIARSGIAAAKNLGLFASKAPISLFFDDDDRADSRLLAAHLDAHEERPEENVAILGYTTWAPEVEVTPVMEYATDIGQHLFAYRNLSDGQALDFTYFWGGRSSCKRSFLAEHGSFNQDLWAMEDIELAFRLSRHGLKVVHKRDAVSYMLRSLTFQDFCRRCEGQGRALWRFHRLHDDPAVREYCRADEAVQLWPAEEQALGRTVDRVRELERRLEGSQPPEEREGLLEELQELYGWAFRVHTAKGFVETKAQEEGLAGGRAPVGRREAPLPEVAESSALQGALVRTGRSMQDVCPNPVFIIGSPRSGTSILAHSLAQHPDFWTEAESDILFYLLGQGHLEKAFQTSRSRPDGAWLGRQGVDQREFLSYLGLGLNALFTSRSGGRRWVDQTPLYTLVVDLLADLFPGAYFLHILRDGRRVVHSMVNFSGAFRNEETENRMEEAGRLPAWTRDFHDACRTWSRFVNIAMEFADRLPERVLTVRNEHLAADPEGGFRQILSFLGASYEPAPAHFFATHRINSSFRDKGADGSPRDPWRDWTSEQQTIFEAQAGPTMETHGLIGESRLSAQSGHGSHREQQNDSHGPWCPR
jgi:GT2 family glycosyltransferase